MRYRSRSSTPSHGGKISTCYLLSFGYENPASFFGGVAFFLVSHECVECVGAVRVPEFFAAPPTRVWNVGCHGSSGSSTPAHSRYALRAAHRYSCRSSHTVSQSVSGSSSRRGRLIGPNLLLLLFLEFLHPLLDTRLLFRCCLPPQLAQVIHSRRVLNRLRVERGRGCLLGEGFDTEGAALTPSDGQRDRLRLVDVGHVGDAHPAYFVFAEGDFGVGVEG